MSTLTAAEFAAHLKAHDVTDVEVDMETGDPRVTVDHNRVYAAVYFALGGHKAFVSGPDVVDVFYTLPEVLKALGVPAMAGEVA